MKQCLTCLWGHKQQGIVLCPFQRCIKKHGFYIEKIKSNKNTDVKVRPQ